MAPCSLTSSKALKESAAFVYKEADFKMHAVGSSETSVPLPTHCCLSTTTHFAVEWYSRYSFQISAQKTAVIAGIPVGFRTSFKNMLGTCVKLFHDRYAHVLSNFISHSMKATDGVSKYSNVPPFNIQPLVTVTN